MKKIVFLILIFISLNVNAQIKVKENSFHQIEGFVMLDKMSHYDDNEKPMALIKISTENITAEERSRITFKGNLETYFDVRFEPSEIYLYISAQAATFIEIHHPDYGKTEYRFPYDLKDFCGYELVIQYISMNFSSEEVQQNNYLSIIADQDNASVYIDDEYVGDKEGFKSCEIGSTHSWRIECDLYHSESGTVTITEGDAITIEKALRPAFGYIKVNSLPEGGATVFINNKKVGVTPYLSNRMASGTYNVKVVKEMFNAAEMSFTILDGETTVADMNMTANFVNVTINTEADAIIYVDEQYKAKGSWKGRLHEGKHFVEVKKDNHKTVSKNITLVMGEDVKINIDAPIPITGLLDISSKPLKADIYLNGKYHGQTPKIISNILIGDYNLELKKEGYAVTTEKISIEENKTTTIYEELSTSKEVVTKNDVEDDKTYYLGTMPLTTYLSQGINYITANIAYSAQPQLSYGLSFGSVENVGWFVTAMSNFDFIGFAKEGKTEESLLLTGESRTTRLSLTAGILAKKPMSPMCFKLGLGLGLRYRCLKAENGKWYEYYNNSYKGLDVLVGLQCHLKHFTFDIDMVTTNFKTLEFKLGVGCNWKKR